MTDRAQELLREALTLAAEERADVAAELLADAYGVNGMPTTVDAQGRARYQTTGFHGDDTAREQEVVIKELLKDISSPPR